MKNGDTPPFEKSRKQECFRVLEELLGRLSRAKRLSLVKCSILYDVCSN